MIKRIFFVILTTAILLGSAWLSYNMFTNQLINPESVFVFYFDVFGYLSFGIFGMLGLFLVGTGHRVTEAIKNQDIQMSVTPFWVAFAVCVTMGLAINYTNYFVNIKDEGLVSCEFHVQRSKDWIVRRYARIQEDCEKKGVRVSD